MLEPTRSQCVCVGQKKYGMANCAGSPHSIRICNVGLTVLDFSMLLSIL